MILTTVAAHRLKDTKRKLYDSDYCSENAIFTNIVCHCVKSRTLHAKTFKAALSRTNCFGIALLIETCPERLLDNSTRWNLSGASADVSYVEILLTALNWANSPDNVCVFMINSMWKNSAFIERRESFLIVGYIWNLVVHLNGMIYLGSEWGNLTSNTTPRYIEEESKFPPPNLSIFQQVTRSSKKKKRILFSQNNSYRKIR